MLTRHMHRILGVNFVLCALKINLFTKIYIKLFQHVQIGDVSTATNSTKHATM